MMMIFFSPLHRRTILLFIAILVAVAVIIFIVVVAIDTAIIVAIIGYASSILSVVVERALAFVAVR
jgi:conjugal transfer/entry exclusion protein